MGIDGADLDRFGFKLNGNRSGGIDPIELNQDLVIWNLNNLSLESD